MSRPPLELVAGKPAHGGSCVGRVDGRVVFCGHCLPGETVRAVPDADAATGSRFWRAEAVEVLAGVNPHRRPSPCPWFGPGQCGGCDWLHAEPSYQRQLKAEVLAETLHRIGGVQWSGEVGDLGLDSGWRTRATLHADDLGRLGFHAARSNAIVAIGRCRQMDPAAGLGELLEASWPAGASVHVSLSEAGRAVVVTDRGRRSRSGLTEHVHTVAGRRFTRAVDGFWQSHKRGAQLLVERVRSLAEVPASGTVVDLYAGVGLFGLSLADRVPDGRVVLVEGDRTAAGHARANAGQDDRVRVVGTDVRRWRPQPADLVVLDPPRAGAGRRVVEAVSDSRAAVVVYVSCEPSTLARDLALFAARGYGTDHIEAWDLFPGTAHLECVVTLRAGAV